MKDGQTIGKQKISKKLLVYTRQIFIQFNVYYKKWLYFKVYVRI